MISPAPISRLKLSVCFRARSRRGLSVVELLAATVISLIVMGATVQLFGTVGNQITNGRSNIELSDRLRTAVERLRKDLRGLTVDPLAWNRPESASGYLEIIKGPPSSWDQYSYKSWTPAPAPSSLQSAATTPGATLTGYTQDMLFFTTRSRDLPFVGRVQNTPVESQVAEVAWYLQPTKNSQNAQMYLPGSTSTPIYTLYRRQFLVLPGLNMTGVVSATPPPSIPTSIYYDPNAIGGTVPLCDISAHPSGSSMVLNSLADLSYRENRFAHFYNATANFPAPVQTTVTQMFAFPPPLTSDPNVRYGEDVVLANVLSFDVKVWDPWAQVLQDANGNPLVPSDPGYSNGTKIGVSGVYGAYVDLNWGSGLPSSVTSNPQGVPAPYFVNGYYGLGQKSYLVPTTAAMPATYDTWSAGYESWLPAGGPTTSNISNNGFDNDGANGVNDPNERLTCPPYPVPLRGIQIKIRTYEFTSRQVREVTLQESFVPD